MCVWWFRVASTATFITFTVCSPRGRSAPVSGMIVPRVSEFAVKPCAGSEFVAQRCVAVTFEPPPPPVVELPVLDDEPDEFEDDDPVLPTLTTPPLDSD